MMSLSPKHSHSARHTLRLQYFFYFSVLGIFLPYFNLYCYHLDFSGFQIGLISAVRTVTTVVFPVFWGIVADRLRIRKPIYIVCGFLSTLIWSFFLLTTDFKVMLVISLIYGIFYAPIIAFLEAITIELLGHEKNKYGTIRVWGSIGFIVVTVGIGQLTDIYPIRIILYLILAGSLMHALTALRLPATGISSAESISFNKNSFPWFRLIAFLTCAFLMLLSHGTYYGFFSIHLEKLGFDKTFIGIAWALATLAEIPVMLMSNTIFKKVSFERVLVFSFCAAAGRWLILSSTSSGAVILMSQIMHAVTYGAFHVASILYIDKLIPDEAKTFGQAINNAISYGLGITAGFIISGYFFDIAGSSGLFVFSSIAAVVGGLLMAGLLMINPGKPAKTES